MAVGLEEDAGLEPATAAERIAAPEEAEADHSVGSVSLGSIRVIARNMA